MNWEHFKQQVNADPVIAQRGAGSGFRVLIGWGAQQHLITVRDGAVAKVETGPFVMPPCDFALSGSADAWTRFSSPHPGPRDQDIFSFFRSGEISLTGDTRKFYAHLLCLKLMLLHLRGLS